MINVNATFKSKSTIGRFSGFKGQTSYVERSCIAYQFESDECNSKYNRKIKRCLEEIIKNILLH